MANIQRVYVGSDAYNIAIPYCICSTAAGTAAKEATLSTFSLDAGASVKVKFTYANSAENPTLNINGTGAKNIVGYGTVAPTVSWQAGSVIEFTYDGTSYVMTNFGAAALGAHSGTVSTHTVTDPTATLKKTAGISLSDTATDYYITVGKDSQTAGKSTAKATAKVDKKGVITAGSGESAADEKTINTNVTAKTFYIPKASTSESSGTASATATGGSGSEVTAPTATVSAKATGFTPVTGSTTAYYVDVTADANSGVVKATGGSASASVTASAATVGVGYNGTTVTVGTTAANKNASGTTYTSTAKTASTNTRVYIPAASASKQDATASATITAASSATVSVGGMATTTVNTGYSVSASANSGKAKASVTASAATITAGYTPTTLTTSTAAKEAETTASTASTATYVQKGVLSAGCSTSAGSASMSPSGFSFLASGTSSYSVTLSTSNGSATGSAGVGTEGYVKSETASSGAKSVTVNGATTRYIAAAGVTYGGGTVSATAGTASIVKQPSASATNGTASASASQTGMTAGVSSTATSYYFTSSASATGGSASAASGYSTATGGSARITDVTDTRTAGYLPARSTTTIVSGSSKSGNTATSTEVTKSATGTGASDSSTIYLKAVTHAVSSNLTNVNGEGTVYPGAITIANSTTAVSGKTRVACTPTTATTTISTYYIATQATAAANNGQTFGVSGYDTTGAKDVCGAGYCPGHTPTGRADGSGTATANVSSKSSSVTYIPLTTGVLTASGSISGSVTVTPGAVTVANNTTAVSGKTRIDVAPSTATSGISTYYMAVKPSVAAGSGTGSCSGKAYATVSTSGYVTSSQDKNAEINGTVSGSSSQKDGSVYYIPVATAAFEKSGASVKTTSTGAGWVPASTTVGTISSGTATGNAGTLSNTSYTQDTSNKKKFTISFYVSAPEPTVSAGYISSGTAGTAANRSTSITITDAQAQAAVGAGTAKPAASISGSSATASLSGTTLTLSKTISNTPQITTAGYISSGTAGDTAVSLSGTVPTQSKEATTNGTVSPDAGKLLNSVTVNVPASAVTSGNKSCSSGESDQSGIDVTSYKTVSISGVGTSYVGSAVPRNSPGQGLVEDYYGSDGTNQRWCRIPYGYYSAGGSKANCTYLYLTDAQLKGWANTCGLGYDAGYSSGYNSGYNSGVSDTKVGTAGAAQVLSGYTFTNSSSVGVSGTMTNNGAVSPSALSCGGSYTIPAGYHNGSGKVTAASLSSQTGVDSGKTAVTAGAMRSGYQGWVNGSKITGTMANQTPAFDGGAPSISTSSTSASGTNISITDTDTDPGTGIYITTSGAATPKRAAVLYNGAVNGYVSIADNTTASAAATGSSTSLSTNKYYVTGINMPAAKTLSNAIFNGNSFTIQTATNSVTTHGAISVTATTSGTMKCAISRGANTTLSGWTDFTTQYCACGTAGGVIIVKNISSDTVTFKVGTAASEGRAFTDLITGLSLATMRTAYIVGYRASTSSNMQVAVITTTN